MPKSAKQSHLRSAACGRIEQNNNKSGGVLKSMLTLNEAIIDVKEG